MPYSYANFSTIASFNLAAGDVAWTNPSHAQTSNDAYASADLAPLLGYDTDALRCTQGTTGVMYNGLVEIPDSATIDEITVVVEGKDTRSAGANSEFALVQLTDAGASIGNDISNNETMTATDVRYAFTDGGTWGATLTGADVKGATFGVDVQIECDNSSLSAEPRIDHVHIGIHWSYASGSTPLPPKRAKKMAERLNRKSTTMAIAGGAGAFTTDLTDLGRGVIAGARVVIGTLDSGVSVVVTNEDGLDILNAQCSSITANTDLSPVDLEYMPVIADQTHTVTVASGGSNGNVGTLYLYILMHP